MTAADIAKEVGGAEGWFHSGSGEDVADAAQLLIDAGTPPDVILEALERVAGAIANEYGA